MANHVQLDQAVESDCLLLSPIFSARTYPSCEFVLELCLAHSIRLVQ